MCVCAFIYLKKYIEPCDWKTMILDPPCQSKTQEVYPCLATAIGIWRHGCHWSWLMEFNPQRLQ